MYDIKPLEEEWEEYNKKKKRPLYIIIGVLSSVIAIGAYLTYSKSSMISFDSNKSLASSSVTPADALIDKSITKLEVKKDFVEQSTVAKEAKPVVVVANNNNPMNDSDVFIDVDSAVKKHGKIITTTKVLHKKEVEVPRSKKKINFNMIDANDPRAYREIASRFEMAPDSDDSLFLARMYFKDKNYSQAAKWALKTNKLDGDIEESWLIFAKSKSNIGQKNEAIRVLSEYAKRSNSMEAYKLLKQLKR
jgi:tetratricopeptide (TPR) repeat protein